MRMVLLLKNTEKINYIYGTNGCGKTTISNFLSNTEEDQFSDCEVEWENNTSEKYLYTIKLLEKRILKKVI